MEIEEQEQSEDIRMSTSSPIHEDATDLLKDPVESEEIRDQSVNEELHSPENTRKSRRISNQIKSPTTHSINGNNDDEDDVHEGTKSNSKSKNKNKTPVSSAKKNSKSSSSSKTSQVLSSAVKKKKLNELKQTITDIEDNIEELKKQQRSQKLRLAKLIKASEDPLKQKVKFPMKDELIATLDVEGKPLTDLPTPYIEVDSIVPAECVDDVMGIYDFLNTFNKQLLLQTITFDDICDVLKFTGRNSGALTDIYCSLLRLILGDSHLLHKLIAALPKRTYFESGAQTVADSKAEKETALNEDFDTAFNGLKFLQTKKLDVELLDSMRFQLVLRAVLLRLEPVKRLRKTVQEIYIAMKYQYDHDTLDKMNVEEFESDQFGLLELEKLNNEFKHIVSSSVSSSSSSCNNNSSDDNKSNAMIGIENKVRFETPAKNVEKRESMTTRRQSKMISHETLLMINTPGKKNRAGAQTPAAGAQSALSKKHHGLDKDGIFRITSNAINNLHRIYHAARELETKELYQLSIQDKVAVLKALIDACYDTQRLQELLDRNAEERNTQYLNMNKALREQKNKLKEVSLSRRDAAIARCKLLHQQNHSANKSKKSGKSNYEPSAEEIQNMIEEMIIMEKHGVDKFVEDFVFEDEDEDDDNNDHDINNNNNNNNNSRKKRASGDEENEEESEGVRESRKRTRSEAPSRMQSRSRSRAEQRENKKRLTVGKYRRQQIEAASARIDYILQTNTSSEREVRAAIKQAERAGLRGVENDEEEDEEEVVYCTMKLKQAYKALHDLEEKIQDDKLQLEHERALEEYFVRREPLGVDRNHSLYWHFRADEHCLFIQQRVSAHDAQLEDQLDFGPVPPPEDTLLNTLFRARPSQHRYKWFIYSTKTELVSLLEALDDRGEREKELKAKILASFDLSSETIGHVTIYQSKGSEHIGKRVQRSFGENVVVGKVVGYLPATEEDPALWHVYHLDGDEEDLEEHEVLASIAAYEETLRGDAEELSSSVARESEQRETAEEVDLTDSVDGDEEKVRKRKTKDTEPRVVQKLGLSKTKLARGSFATNAIGVHALKQELQRLMNIIYEELKKRASENDRDVKEFFHRDLKKQWEVNVREAEICVDPATGQTSLPGLQQCLLQLEEIVHATQYSEDRHETDKASRLKLKRAKKREAEREHLRAEGWILAGETAGAGHAEDSDGRQYLGVKVRRFFKRFGASDGVVTAVLPAEKNENVTLLHVEHEDGDAEDLDLEDFARGREAVESDARQPINGVFDDEEVPADGEDRAEDSDEDESDVESHAESDSSDSDEEEEEDADSGSKSLRLWPSSEVRERWILAIGQSRTVAELSFALSALEEQLYYYDLLTKLDPEMPLMLYTPPVSRLKNQPANSRPGKNSKSNLQSNKRSTANSSKSNNQQASTITQRMLATSRQAKNRAKKELSRYQGESDESSESEADLRDSDEETSSDDSDQEPASAHRTLRSSNNNDRKSHYTRRSNQDNDTLYSNTGRPTRSAAAKIASYK